MFPTIVVSICYVWLVVFFALCLRKINALGRAAAEVRILVMTVRCSLALSFRGLISSLLGKRPRGRFLRLLLAQRSTAQYGNMCYSDAIAAKSTLSSPLQSPVSGDSSDTVSSHELESHSSAQRARTPESLLL